MHDFEISLQTDKELIDRKIQDESRELLSQVAKDYGETYADVLAAYTDVLARGGKRMRGILAKRVYEFFGGQNKEVALEAAVVIEMLHDYLLVIDDIEDASELRRGKPAAHILLRDYHTKKQLSGKAAHYGISQAINAALAGQNLALLKTLRLPVKPEYKLAASTHLNDFLVKTSLGQLGDFNNEAFRTNVESDVLQVLKLKTAYYTFCMPTYFGAALAGANQLDPKLDDHLVNTGIAFQIYDDIIGTFGEVSQTGKSNMNDLTEGKRTLLTVYAYEAASSAERAVLDAALGNSQLSGEQFEAARTVIRDTGALQRCQDLVSQLTTDATKLLAESTHTPPAMATFLNNLAVYLAASTKV